jgi:Holliday junction resolvasome RuvABC endonuclease subunit
VIPVSSPAVIGIDPSSTGTAIAHGDGTVRVVRLSNLPKGSVPGVRMGRIERIVCEVQTAVEAAGPINLAVILHAAASQAELGGILRWHLWRQGITVLELAPGTLKKFATGDGSASKTAMVIAARDRLGYDGLSDDEADALWLRAAGLTVLGEPPAGVTNGAAKNLLKVAAP